MNDDYTKYLRKEVSSFGLTFLVMLASITGIFFFFYMINEDAKLFLVVSIELGSATIALVFNYLAVVLNSEKYIELFGPSFIGAIATSVVALNISNLLNEEDV